MKTLKAMSTDGSRGRNVFGRLLPRRRQSHTGQHEKGRVWESKSCLMHVHGIPDIADAKDCLAALALKVMILDY